MNAILLVITTCLFVLAMLGHFVGDYTFQNDWIALNKARRDRKGWLTCGVHAFLYTFAVVSFLSIFIPRLFIDWKLWLVIGVPHYIIDHYSIASYIMKWKNGIKPFEAVSPCDEFGIVQNEYSKEHLIPAFTRDETDFERTIKLDQVTQQLAAKNVVYISPNGVGTLWKVGFLAPVYIMNDNVLHFVCLYFTCMAIVFRVV